MSRAIPRLRSTAKIPHNIQTSVYGLGLILTSSIWW